MSTTQNKQVVLVFGATGKQGGAVIRTLLQKKDMFQLRGVSRIEDQQEEAAKLQEKGVEMVKADIATGEGLDVAFKNVYAAFLITNSFEKGIEGNEFECGKALVDKAINCGVKNIVWSSSPNAHALSQGKWDVPQFTEKAKVEEYIRNLQKEKQPFQSVSFITPTWYFQNFCKKGLGPTKDEKGTLCWKLPQIKSLVGCDVNDVGLIFCNILCNPDKFNDKNIVLDGDTGSTEDYVHNFERVTHTPSTFKPIKPEELEECPDLHHGRQLSQMFQFLNEFPYPPEMSENTCHAKKCWPELKSFNQWLEQSGWKGEELHP
jgi:hypothetical protein